MNKVITLSVLVGLLFLMNLALMAFIFMNKGPKGLKHNPTENHDQFIQKEFGLDKDQMANFDKSKTKHMENSRLISDNIKEASRKYYNTDSSDIKKKDSLLSVVIGLSEEIYQTNDVHFQEMRVLVGPDKSEAMTKFIRNLIEGNKRPNRPKKRKK